MHSGEHGRHDTHVFVQQAIKLEWLTPAAPCCILNASKLYATLMPSEVHVDGKQRSLWYLSHCRKKNELGLATV
jgi:hypothetical protein